MTDFDVGDRGRQVVDEPPGRLGYWAMNDGLEVTRAKEVRLGVRFGVVVHLLDDVLQMVVGGDPRQCKARLHPRLLILHRLFDVLDQLVVRFRITPLREPVGGADSQRSQCHPENRQTALHERVPRHVELRHASMQLLLKDVPGTRLFRPS